MEENSDSIDIELKVTAAQIYSDIWMQGDLEIFINGERPYYESDITDTESLLQNLEADGEHFIFNCCCGVLECSV